MAKRFTDTNKWTNNKWFFSLPLELKLFWFYLLDMCDQVGVWEENVLLANKIIGYEYSIDTLLKAFEKQIYVFNGNRKWWIIDFCKFQYSGLNEDSNSKPILSHISLLKQHNLWEEYLKGLSTLKEKETDKDIDKEKDEDRKEENDPAIEFYRNEFEKSTGHALQTPYYRFVGTIFNTKGYNNELGEPAKHIVEIEKQLEFDQFIELSSGAKKRGLRLLDLLESLINNPKYAKGKKSLYLTLNNWVKRESIQGTNFGGEVHKASLVENSIGKKN